MAESSNAANSATLSDCQDGSRGICSGYNTSYGQLTIPNYMNHSPKINDTMSQVDVLEDMNKTGYGSNSDDNFFDVYNLVYDIW